MSHYIAKKHSPWSHLRMMFRSPNVYTTAYVHIYFPFPHKCSQGWYIKRSAYRLGACAYWCTDFSFTLLSICPIWKCHGKYPSHCFTALGSWRKLDFIAVEKNFTLPQLFSSVCAFRCWYAPIIAQIYWQLWLLGDALLPLKLLTKFASFHRTRNSISHCCQLWRISPKCCWKWCRAILRT